MDNLADRFNALRVTVEAMAGSHAVVVVAGGRERDGAGAVARGLAQAFSETGARVGLVSSDPVRRERTAVTVVPLASVQAYAGVRLTERFAKLRADFDIVIVEIPALFERSFDSELARRCDGVVLAVEAGRRVTAHDNEIGVMLERLAVRRYGVVMTKPELRYNAYTVAPGVAGRSSLVRRPSAQRI